MKKTIASIVFLCACFSMQAQLLWKISGNGLEQSSYLFGTHHLAPIRIMEDIVELRPALNRADQVVGEMVMSNLHDPEIMMQMQQMILMPGDTTLSMLFTPEQYTLINSYTKENIMLDMDVVSVLKPTVIQNNLVVALYLKLIGDGYNPQFQLDSFIQKIGADNGKKILGLEDPAFQFDLLFNKSTLSRQAALLLCLVENIDKNMQNARELTEAYMAQDLEKMEALALERDGTQCDPLPGEWEAMVDNRNVSWAQQLPDILREGSTFIAVGALHLPGRNGLLSLLREQGYQLEALP
ncbi:MAG: TraB/GumN family protein [Bacteroides sp.]|nr:TraB/GumN family protein [Bacteroides sp.]